MLEEVVNSTLPLVWLPPKEKNKKKETFQKQNAMLEEVVKLPLALVRLVWLGPKRI